MTYIVFFNAPIGGFKHIRDWDSENIDDAIQNISRGNSPLIRGNNSIYNYYIYKLHDPNISLIGTRFYVYKFVKHIAGQDSISNSQCHKYALDTQYSMAWFFADDPYGDDEDDDEEEEDDEEDDEDE